MDKEENTPVEEKEEGLSDTVLNTANNSGLKKVLIVDDDKIFTKILTDTLPADKYEVISAFDGEAGLTALREKKPHIVILDLKMPKMGGIEFLQELKNQPGGNPVPILISSQLSSMSDVSEAVTAGIDVGVKGYIIKATENMEMILQTIEKHLK